ncbi:MAG: hypothetical protein IT428_15300 [Planctomycetaceae bacterium]|nr:hypothetical protein [Planctomycetaceae bacterium]
MAMFDRVGNCWAFLGCSLVALGLSAAPVLAQGKSSSGSSPKAALIVLKARDSKVTPQKFGYSATGGGTVTVTQPTPDTILITMSGVVGVGACACGDSHAMLDFVLDQEFEVEFAKGTPQSGRIEIEGRVYGLLRTEGKKGGGTAHMTRAFATVNCGEAIASVTLDPQGTACGNGLAVTSVRGPVAGPVVPGCFHLHQEFGIAATQPKCLLPRKASADFAPPPTLDSRWINNPDPFREANRTNNGFQVTIRLIQDASSPAPAQLALPPAPVNP